MNPRDELLSLTNLFQSTEPLFLKAEHLPASLTPEPYKSLLVHDHHMTVAMETFHGGPVDVRVLNHHQHGDIYTREIILLKGPSTRPDEERKVVQYGIVRFNFSYVTDAVRNEIIAGKTPLGRVLINHNVLRHIDLGAILEISAGPRLARLFKMPEGGVTYGRLATIFCNRQPAVDLLEISAPLEIEAIAD
jgi:chorismate-pyruvate lyase